LAGAAGERPDDPGRLGGMEQSKKAKGPGAVDARASLQVDRFR
jgi:hypothetical protein